MNKYKIELMDLKALIYNSIPERTLEDSEKDIFELVELLKVGIRKQSAKEIKDAIDKKFNL